MLYLPHTNEDIASMLKVVGAKDLESLFSMILKDCRRTQDMNLPVSLSEWELNSKMDELAGINAVAPEYNIFLGAGSYDHFIPQAAMYLLRRSEFVTSYTPYQPEISQRTLQGIFGYPYHDFKITWNGNGKCVTL